MNAFSPGSGSSGQDLKRGYRDDSDERWSVNGAVFTTADNGVNVAVFRRSPAKRAVSRKVRRGPHIGRARRRSRPSLWEFSLGLYRRAGVEKACLNLQDRAGADVNIVLFLLFLALNGRRVLARDVARIDRLVRDWRENVVKPLRSVRRTLGANDRGLLRFRNSIKRSELEAERLEQALLAQCATLKIGKAAPPGEITAAKNLTVYLRPLDRLSKISFEALIGALSSYYADNSAEIVDG